MAAPPGNKQHQLLGFRGSPSLGAASPSSFCVQPSAFSSDLTNASSLRVSADRASGAWERPYREEACSASRLAWANPSPPVQRSLDGFDLFPSSDPQQFYLSPSC